MEDFEKAAAKEIIEFKNKNGRNPSYASKDPYEKKLAIKLSKFKQAKQGKGGRVFYPSLQKLAEEAGYPDLFEDLEKTAIEVEGKDVIPKSSLRMAEEAGLPDLFAGAVTKEEAALRKVRIIIDFKNKIGRDPSSQSKDAEDRSLATWLFHMRAAKKGKGRYKFYDSCQKLAEELGYPDLFEYTDREKVHNENTGMLIKFIKETGKYPSVRSSDPKEVRLANWYKSQKNKSSEQDSGVAQAV